MGFFDKLKDLFGGSKETVSNAASPAQDVPDVVDEVATEETIRNIASTADNPVGESQASINEVDADTTKSTDEALGATGTDDHNA